MVHISASSDASTHDPAVDLFQTFSSLKSAISSKSAWFFLWNTHIFLNVKILILVKYLLVRC